MSLHNSRGHAITNGCPACLFVEMISLVRLQKAEPAPGKNYNSRNRSSMSIDQNTKMASGNRSMYFCVSDGVRGTFRRLTGKVNNGHSIHGPSLDSLLKPEHGDRVTTRLLLNIIAISQLLQNQWTPTSCLPCLYRGRENDTNIYSLSVPKVKKIKCSAE